MNYELIILIPVFGAFILLAFRMGYQAGKAKETLVKMENMPEPVEIQEFDFIDEEMAKEDAEIS